MSLNDTDLLNENNKLQSLVSRMRQDYIKDMEYKDKKIRFLESECKRIYDPIREFWNLEKNEEMEQLKKSIKLNRILIDKLQSENNQMKEALLDASEYCRKDDVNGQAGEIAKECLDRLFKGEKNDK